MAEIDIAVGRLDVDHFVAPHEGAAAAQTADAVSAKRIPGLDRIADDLRAGDGAQTVSECANFQSVLQEAIAETGPHHGHGDKEKREHENNGEANGAVGGHAQHDERRYQQGQECESPRASGMSFFRQDFARRKRFAAMRPEIKNRQDDGRRSCEQEGPDVERCSGQVVFDYLLIPVSHDTRDYGAEGEKRPSKPVNLAA